MNIKSEFLKQTIPLFPNFSVAILLFSIVLGGFLSLGIIAFGQGVWIKLLALVIGMVILLTWTFDKTLTKMEDRDTLLKKGLGIFVLTILIIEAPLYFNAHSKKETSNISIVVLDKTRDGERIPDNDNDDANDKYIQIKYQLVLFYDLDTTKQIEYRKVQENEKKELSVYDNIVGKETFIDYFPFFIYTETFRYIRDENATKY